MSNKIIRRGFLAVALAVAAASAQADVFNMPSGDTSLQFVTVGNPGNAPDPATGGLYGAVSYTYQMGTYDVTLAQYTAFLNAVAKTDTYGLYNSAMDSDYAPMEGISQSGTPGSYSYSVTGSAPGAANMPVFNVTWGDAARFCNWLQNGQPTGAEGNGTTETGAYTLSGDTTTYLETRNPGATYVIPSENEWYKAAYYNPSSGIYWTYPTQSNAAPNNSLALAGSTPNEANYLIGTTYTDPTNHLTPVGTFSDSPGPFGTYDMGGNVWQWNEAIILTSRGLRGGVWGSYDTYLASSGRNRGGPQNVADIDVSFIGFRVAKVPAPGGIIAQWNMDTLGTQAAPYNSPAATTNNTQDKNGAGAPVATALGMQNDYAFIDSGTTVAVGSVTDCDILSTTGNTAAGGSGKTAYAWRIRGPGTNGYNPATGTPTGTGNGWSNSAPQYSQGVQFNADTTGYSNIAVAFNYYCTSQGIRDLQFQYTINGSTWVSFGPTLISVPGDWYSSSGIVEDLSGIPGVNNDPNFGVRMVSAYDSTGNLGDNYASATLASGLTQPYNDYSGNWRFGTVTIETMPPSNPVWASAGPGNWSDSTKWTGSVPNAVGAVAVFDVSTTAAVTVTLNTPVTLGTLQLGNFGNTSVGYTLSGSGRNTLTLNNSGSAATIAVASGTHAIDAPVLLASNLVVTSTGSSPWSLSFGTAGSIAQSGTGSYSLTMSGNGGTLLLSGSNTYSGDTTISGGTLAVTNPASLGAANGSLSIGPATLEVTSGFSSTRNIALTDPQATIQVDPSVTYSNAGAISGTGGLNKTGAGELVLSSSDTYSGGTVVEAGTLEVTSTSALPTGTSLIVGARGTLAFDPSVAAASAADAPAAVPEPSTLALLSAGAISLVAYAWRRWKQMA